MSLDFSSYDDGNDVNQGDWLSDQFQNEHGLTITASGGASSMNGKPRIFDTSDARCVEESDTFKGRSIACDDSVPGEVGENCDPIGSKIFYLYLLRCNVSQFDP